MRNLLVAAGVVVGLAVVVAAAPALVAWAAAPAKGPDVLIIHGGGTPSEQMGKFTAENVDAVSCPTPVGLNCVTAAAQVAEALGKMNLDVKVLGAEEVAHRNEILGARLVVLASPCYFSNASWKMQKLFHEKFYQIHALGGERLTKKPFAALAIGGAEPKCAKTIQAMQDVVVSCNGTPGPTAIVLTGKTADEVKEITGKFAEAIAGLLKEAK